MTVLGAVLAGGQARRYGSDKAVALLDGERLIDRVIATLTRQTDAIVVVGRDGVSDRPANGLGPLGGLNAALHHARASGHDWVVSVPCDAPQLPADLVDRLRGDGPRFAAVMPVIGWWPAALADRLDDHLATGEDRSMRAWVRAISAVPVEIGAIANVNTVEDLARLNAGSAGPRRA